MTPISQHLIRIGVLLSTFCALCALMFIFSILFVFNLHGGGFTSLHARWVIAIEFVIVLIATWRLGSVIEAAIIKRSQSPVA
jgi:hypothetical protein